LLEPANGRCFEPIICCLERSFFHGHWAVIEIAKSMSIKGKAFIVGAFEHPGRKLPDRTLAQIHADVAVGALADAGLELRDVDGFFCSTDAPGFGPLSMADYLGLKCTFMDTTNLGGSSPVAQVGHAAAAIAAGKCRVALVTLGGKPLTGGSRPMDSQRSPTAPEYSFEQLHGLTTPAGYALAARRHMHEYGTTSEQLAWIKVAASRHAQHNPNARLPFAVTVEQVLESPMVADPLHRLDCCVITDGGGALVVVAPEVARDLARQAVKVLGHGEAVKHSDGGRIDLTYTGARWSGAAAFAEAGVKPADIHYASIYDSFTITVLETIEDLGFCEKGQGGAFVADGGLVAPAGRLPFNTDGGGLCNNHPGNRGGVTKVIEAVRQLRGEAHPAVQVPNCELALAHGTGGNLGNRMGSATLILGRADS
jgi:acetyl-CoA C-acetyltransferase